VLVHHVHREQWPVVYPGLAGKVGWAIESQVARRAFAGCQYVAVSQATRDELIRIGVRAADIAVVHNGAEPAPPVDAVRSPTPLVCTLGRLVPHKQVEHAIDAVAALHAEIPDLRLIVVGAGWWEDELHQYVTARGLDHLVTFEGHAEARRKHEILAASWVLALPSLKEGWGLVVGEAAQHRVPTLAYRSAGGTTESVTDQVTGLLADSREEYRVLLRRLVLDDALRTSLGEAAHKQANAYTWEHATVSFEAIIDAAVKRRRHVHDVDPE
jgi:glycosyltransferase involved in cell wall biosynthesis